MKDQGKPNDSLQEHKPNKSLLEAKGTFGSSLPPIINDRKSPYYSESGIPQTTGDYKARKAGVLKRKFPVLLTALKILAGVTTAIYVTNVLVVYDKEKQLAYLLKEKERLQKLNG